MMASKLPPPALIGPQRVVHVARPVEADRDREAVLLEEVRVGLGQQRAVGGDREVELHARARARVPPRGASRPAAPARLTSGSPPRNARLSRAPGSAPRDEEVDRRGRPSCSVMFFAGAAELALLRVAVGAAEVALLRHRQRQRVHGRAPPAACRRSAARPAKPDALRARARRPAPPAIAAPSSPKSAASTSNSRLPSATKQVPPVRRLDQVRLGHARRRGVHVVAGIDAARRSVRSFGLPQRFRPRRCPPIWNCSHFSQSLEQVVVKDQPRCPRSRPARTRRSAPSAASCRRC